MMNQNLFEVIRKDDFGKVEEFLNSEDNTPNECNKEGQSGLHLCGRFGYINTAIVLINKGANINMKDRESGWTSLHKSFYFGHFPLSFLLIQSGGRIDDHDKSLHNKQIDNMNSVKDNEGLTPIDLLSQVLSYNLRQSRKELKSSSIMCFGKSDFQLGVPLSKSSADVVRPKHIQSLLSECITQISASKYHSLAITKKGLVYSWGHGRSGRLGHGNEVTQPEPLLIKSLSLNRIKQVASGENHSIAITEDGNIYTWGSDRFGQLGLSKKTRTGSEGEICTTSKDFNGGIVTKPCRIDYLKKHLVIEIAAGDTHSLCRTSNGEVYVWGSNKYGQLGLKPSELSQVPGGCAGSNVPKRLYLDFLCTTNKSYTNNSSNTASKVIQISASYSNTLILLKTNIKNTCNLVYQFGHGINNPLKVNFSRPAIKSRSRSNSSSNLPYNNNNNNNNNMKLSSNITEQFSQFQTLVNIIKVATGEHHYAAISSDADVYTWGLGIDLLGHGCSDISNIVSQPQLVEALLAENGGGKIIDISLAGNRTCAVSDVGDLYTWGATCKQGVLSADPSSNYQPIPRKVSGIKQAISVSAGEDHTLVLTSCTVPILPLDYHYSNNIQQNVNSDNNSSYHMKNSNIQTVYTEGHSRSNSIYDEFSNSDDDDDDDKNDDINTYKDDINNTQNNLKESNRIFIKCQEFNEIQIPTLMNICERELSKALNIKTIISALIFAEKYNANLLTDYCNSFIKMNLDGILAITKPNEIGQYLEMIGCSNMNEKVHEYSNKVTNAISLIDSSNYHIQSSIYNQNYHHNNIKINSKFNNNCIKEPVHIFNDVLKDEFNPKTEQKKQQKQLKWSKNPKSLSKDNLSNLNSTDHSKSNTINNNNSNRNNINCTINTTNNSNTTINNSSSISFEIWNTMISQSEQGNNNNNKINNSSNDSCSINTNNNDNNNDNNDNKSNNNKSNIDESVLNIKSNKNNNDVNNPWIEISKHNSIKPLNQSNTIGTTANTTTTAINITINAINSDMKANKSKSLSNPSYSSNKLDSHHSSTTTTATIVSTPSISMIASNGRTVLSPPLHTKPISDILSTSNNRNIFSLDQFVSPTKIKPTTALETPIKTPTTVTKGWNSTIPNHSSSNNNSSNSNIHNQLDANLLSPVNITPKSFIEIQKEEEKARELSNILVLNGNNNKWYIERRPRADSIDKVMKEQEHQRNEEMELNHALEQIKQLELKEKYNKKKFNKCNKNK